MAKRADDDDDNNITFDYANKYVFKMLDKKEFLITQFLSKKTIFLTATGVKQVHVSSSYMQIMNLFCFCLFNFQ